MIDQLFCLLHEDIQFAFKRTKTYWIETTLEFCLILIHRKEHVNARTHIICKRQFQLNYRGTNLHTHTLSDITTCIQMHTHNILYTQTHFESTTHYIHMHKPIFVFTQSDTCYIFIRIHTKINVLTSIYKITKKIIQTCRHRSQLTV